MKIIKHPAAVRLVEQIIERIPTETTGTYNPGDLTHFEKGEIQVENTDITLTKNDCTWGVTVEIINKNPAQSHTSEIYLDWEDRGLLPRNTWRKNDFILLKNILKLLPPPPTHSNPDYHECF